MIVDYAKLAFETFKTRKKRTLLTMLGIFIGIAAVVSLVSLGQGLQKTVVEQFETLGTNKIIVSPSGGIFGQFEGAGAELTEDDLRVIERTKGIELAGGMLYKLGRVEYKGQTKYTWITGLPQDKSKEIISDMSSFEVEEGRDLRKGDSYKALVGVLLTEDEYFFDRGVSVGDRVELEGKKFEIVGVLGRIGNPEDDSSLIIPLEAAREIFNEPDSYAYVMAQVSQGQDPEVVAERVKKALRKYRGVEEGEEDFSIQTFAELMESFQSVFAIVQAVLIGIAAISLLVGGIGIMNTMFTSVLQRTNQIGVMKAIGARNSDIFKLFLIESGFLGLFGGAIGVVIGIFLSKIVEFAAAGAGLPILKAYFPWYLILGALAFSFFVGCVSGLTPAVRASKLKPVDALRYE